MVMISQEKFRVLVDQIKVSNQLDKEIFEKGEFTRIDVSDKNRSWEFQITSPYFLSNENYLIFTHAIKEEFKDIAHVDWRFTTQDTSSQDEHVTKYFGHYIGHTALSLKVKG